MRFQPLPTNQQWLLTFSNQQKHIHHFSKEGIQHVWFLLNNTYNIIMVLMITIRQYASSSFPYQPRQNRPKRAGKTNKQQTKFFQMSCISKTLFKTVLLRLKHCMPVTADAGNVAMNRAFQSNTFHRLLEHKLLVHLTPARKI